MTNTKLRIVIPSGGSKGDVISEGVYRGFNYILNILFLNLDSEHIGTPHICHSLYILNILSIT